MTFCEGKPSRNCCQRGPGYRRKSVNPRSGGMGDRGRGFEAASRAYSMLKRIVKQALRFWKKERCDPVVRFFRASGLLGAVQLTSGLLPPVARRSGRSPALPYPPATALYLTPPRLLLPPTGKLEPAWSRLFRSAGLDQLHLRRAGPDQADRSAQPRYRWILYFSFLMPRLRESHSLRSSHTAGHAVRCAKENGARFPS